MIDTNGWKRFKIGDLFSVSRGQRHVVGNHEEGDLPYYSASLENNGVTDYIGNPLFIDQNALVITTFGDAFYAEGKFTASDEITILHHGKMNEINGLFIATAIRQNKWKYSFKVKAFKERVSKDSILLPVTSDGQPDWDYMEAYMKAVIKETERSLESLRKADDTKHLIDVSRWGEFDVTDFFILLSGRRKLSNADVDDGETPVYSSNSFNGGIFGYTTKTPDYEINDDNPFYIIFGDHTKAVNIAEKSFCVMDNVKVMTSRIRNYDVLYFIITSWLKNIPNLGYARHWNIAEKTKIYLPVDADGKPDWRYMEEYMKNQMQNAGDNLKALSDIR